MKNKRWKISGLLLSCFMVFGAVPVSVAAEGGDAMQQKEAVFYKAATPLTYEVSPTGFTRKALQGMLDDASEEQAVVINFLAGTYTLDNTLYVHSNTTLNLDPGTKLVRGDNCLALNLMRTADYGASTGTATKEDAHFKGGYDLCHDITINGNGGTIDGGNIATIAAAGGEEESSNIINFGHSSNIKIDKVTFTRCFDAHFVELAGCKDSSITNCKFDGTNSKFSADSDTDDYFEAIQLDICKKEWAGAFKPDKTACKNITIEKNEILNCPRGIGNHHTLAGGHSSGITIKDNKIKTTVKDQMCYKQAILCDGFDDSMIQGNTITGYRLGIHVLDSKNVSVTSNTLSSIKDVAIYTNSTKGEKTSLSEISKNKITTPGNTAISVGDVSSVKAINNNTVETPGLTGIFVASGTTDTINENKISGAKETGISLRAGTVKNVISNTISSPGKSGILCYGATVTEVSKNKITSPKESGIVVDGGKVTSKISSNTVSKAKQSGIAVAGGSVGSIVSNTISTPGAHGVFCYGGTTKDVTSNEISDAKQCGIMIGTSKGTPKVTGAIAKNKISNAKKSGIGVSRGVIGGINNNTVTAAGEQGINCYGGTITEVKANTIKTPVQNGISINGANVTTVIEGNKITSPKAAGIAVKKGTVKTIQKNTISKPKTVGVFGYGGTITNVLSNTLTSCGTHGISMTSGKITNIKTNTITSPKQNGINLSKGTASTVSDNKITGAGSNGIVIGSSAKVKTIDKNTISKAKTHGIVNQANITISSIQNNTISGHKECALYFSNGTAKKISGNKISSFAAAKNQVYAKNNKLKKVYCRVDTWKSSAKKITGQATPKAKISVQIGKKTYSATANKKGKFSIKIPKQKKGTSYTITMKDPYKDTLSVKVKVK